MEPQRESAREGQVEEGVRVALLKLVTDGSRPIGEMSDSYSQQQEKEVGIKYTYFVCVVFRHFNHTFTKVICVTQTLHLNILCIICYLAVTDTVDHLVIFTVESVCQEAQALQHNKDENDQS